MMTDGKPEETAHPAPEEDDAALWSLLERAPRPGPVSPYFARRVLREVAALEEAKPAPVEGALGWPVRLWRAWHGQARGVLAGALGAVVLLAVGAGVSPSRWRAPVAVPGAAAALAGAADADPVEPGIPTSNDAASPSPAAADPPVAAQDVEVIADLDNLLSREESRLWTDENTNARF